MCDESTRIGGESNRLRFRLLFLAGVVLGTGVRTVAWLLPTGLVSTVKDRLP